MPLAGDVYRIQLEGRGHEQKGTRPVIVIQDDGAAVLSTRLCVPTSTEANPADWRVPLLIEDEQTLALTEQTRAISNERFKPSGFIGRVTAAELAEIRAALVQLAGLPLI